MTSLNPKQFHQQALFDPTSVPEKQPHQMKPLEFANHPDTMWHGSETEDFEDLRAETDRHAERNVNGYAQGFHVGTPESARDRQAKWLHPVRIDNEVLYGMDHIDDQGEKWEPKHHGNFYVNEYEDQGSTSAILRSTGDVTHYADFVHDALDRGGIPSGAAEHWATQLDTEHSHHSPGFPADKFAPKQDQVTGERSFERREPYRRPAQAQYTQPSMLVESTTYDKEGYAQGKTWEPSLAAVPHENYLQVGLEAEARRKPWLDRMEREGIEKDLLG